MKKPPFWATSCTIIGFLILCALGTWQVKRLQWKENLITQTLAPAEMITSNDISRKYHFRPVEISGEYLPDTEIIVQPVLNTNHVYTAFRLSDDSILWINRGTREILQHKGEGTPPQKIETTLSGILVETGKKSIFKPDNNIEEKVFYSAIPAEMGEAFTLENVRPFILYLKTPDNDALSPFQPELRNNHMQYAVFWFTMAGLLLLIYYLRFMKRD